MKRGDKCKLIQYCTELFGVFVALVVCVVVASGSLSWFAHNKSVSASGMSITVKTLPDLKIERYVSGAWNEIILYDEHTVTVDYINTSNQGIEPGSHGSFVVRLTNTGTTAQNFRASTEIRTETQNTDAAKFANSHIKVTFGDTEGVINLEPNIPTVFTVYWEWCAEYIDIDEDINADNFGDYLDVSGVFNFSTATDLEKSAAYNSADMKIGTNIRTMYFHLEFTAG